MIGVMAVAGWVAHRKNGFFIINEGWEFVRSIATVAWAVATVGPGATAWTTPPASSSTAGPAR